MYFIAVGAAVYKSGISVTTKNTVPDILSDVRIPAGVGQKAQTVGEANVCFGVLCGQGEAQDTQTQLESNDKRQDDGISRKRGIKDSFCLSSSSFLPRNGHAKTFFVVYTLYGLIVHQDSRNGKMGTALRNRSNPVSIDVNRFHL